jgi:hypothetical protein
MPKFTRPLATGTFKTTDAFRSAPAHIAVMFEDDCTLVAVTGYADDPKNVRESIDYARLFAAAPELLSALQAFVDYHATDYEDIPEMEQARTAIAKARG